MRLKYLGLSLFIAAVFTAPALAEQLKLSSSDIAEGEMLSKAFVFKGFGCEGDNLSPQLSWSGAPQGTKSFAITAYDPDAPTGSGWWHWNIINIPADTTSISRNLKNDADLTKNITQIRNDFGAIGFGGACPPPGEVHRYKFTIYALGVDKLDIPENASNALTGYMTRANTLASDTITAIYKR